MINIVDEIDMLKAKIELEASLREATDVELRNNVTDGPMNSAHQAIVEDIIQVARTIVDKADASDD